MRVTWSCHGHALGILELLLISYLEADIMVVRLHDGGLAVLLALANANVGDVVIQLEGHGTGRVKGFNPQEDVQGFHSDLEYYLIRLSQSTIADDGTLVEAQEEIRAHIQKDTES
jgi:hypothetical protein